MLNKILDIFFPPSCVICGKIGKMWICPKCNIQLKQELNFYKIKKDGSTIYFISFYEGLVRELLLSFKFREQAYISSFLAETISKKIEFAHTIKNYDYIIPVPMYITNKKIRGYNQAELIAHKLGKTMEVNDLTDYLVKIKKNQKQSRLNGQKRIENVKNVYEIKSETLIKEKKILLVDDIYTTGSTVNACIKELKKAKPKQIDILVIAKTIL